MKISINPVKDLDPDSIRSVDPDPGELAAPQKEQAGLQCCGSGFIESGSGYGPDPAFQVNPDPDTNPDPAF